MFTGITNTPRPYSWGSRTAIAELFGHAPTGRPEAEYWLGTHAVSPSLLREGSGTLAEQTTLPFLLKVLAAERPLSLQAHPSLVQAALGFARENSLGIPLDAPNRNYRDSLHKPELIVALADGFEALCGFRSLEQSRAIVQRLRDADAAAIGDSSLDALLQQLTGIREGFAWLISGGPEVAAVVQRAVEVAPAAVAMADAEADAAASAALRTLSALADEYPGDPGVVSSLLLNRVTLQRGEALFLPAGNIHAYLRGFAVEVMAASDNVLRGGLTDKHIDVPELLEVVDFEPLPVPTFAPTKPAPYLEVFAPEIPDFVLARITANAQFSLPGAAIVLVTAGSFRMRGDHSGTVLRKGAALYVSHDERELHFTGFGEVFVASTHIAETAPLAEH